jgi:hypothetical protein
MVHTGGDLTHMAIVHAPWNDVLHDAYMSGNAIRKPKWGVMINLSGALDRHAPIL